MVIRERKITLKKNLTQMKSGRETPQFLPKIRSHKKNLHPKIKIKHKKSQKKSHQIGGDPDPVFTNEKGQSFTVINKKPGYFGKKIKKINKKINIFEQTPHSFLKNPDNQKVWQDIRNLGFFSTSRGYMKRNVHIIEKGISHLNEVYHLQRKVRAIMFALERAIESRIQLIYNSVITKEDFENKNPGSAQHGGDGYQNPYYDIKHAVVYEPALTVVGPSNYDFDNVSDYRGSLIYQAASIIFSKAGFLKRIFGKLSLNLRRKLKNSGKYIRYELDKSYKIILELEGKLKTLIIPLLQSQRSLYIIYKEANFLNGSLLTHYKSNFATANKSRVASLTKDIINKEAKKATYRPLLDAINKHFLAFKKDYMMVLEMYDTSLKGFWIQDEYGRVISRFSAQDSGQVTNTFIDMLKSIDIDKYKNHIASNMMGELYKTISNRDWANDFIIKQPNPTYFEVRVISKERFCYSRSMVQYYVWESLLASQGFNINPKGVMQNPRGTYVQIRPNDEKSLRTSLIRKMLLSDKTLEFSKYDDDSSKFLAWAPTNEGFAGYLSHGAIMGYYDDDLVNMGVPEHPIKKEKRRIADQLRKSEIEKSNIILKNELRTQSEVMQHAGGFPYQQYPQQPLYKQFQQPQQQYPQQQYPQQPLYKQFQQPQQQYPQQPLYKQFQQQPQQPQQTNTKNPNYIKLARNTTKLKNASNRIRVGWMDIWREHYINNFDVISSLINSYLVSSINQGASSAGATSQEYALEQDVYYQYWKEDIHSQFVKAYTGCGMLDALYRTYIRDLSVKSSHVDLVGKTQLESKLSSISALVQTVYTYPMVIDHNSEPELDGPSFKARIKISSILMPKILKHYYDDLQFDAFIFENYIQKILPITSNSLISQYYNPPNTTGAFVNFTVTPNIVNDIKTLVDYIGSAVPDTSFNVQSHLSNLTIKKQSSTQHEPLAAEYPVRNGDTTAISALIPVNGAQGFIGTTPVSNVGTNINNLWYLQILSVLYDSKQEIQNASGGIAEKIVSYFSIVKNAFKENNKKSNRLNRIENGQPIDISLSDHFISSSYYNVNNYTPSSKPLSDYNTIYNLTRATIDINSFRIYINPKTGLEWVSLMSMFSSHFFYNVNVLELLNEMIKILDIHNNDNNDNAVNPRPGTNSIQDRSLYDNVRQRAAEAYSHHQANSYIHLHHKMLYYLKHLYENNILPKKTNNPVVPSIPRHSAAEEMNILSRAFNTTGSGSIAFVVDTNAVVLPVREGVPESNALFRENINKLLFPTIGLIKSHTPSDFLNITILANILGLNSIPENSNPMTYASKEYIKSLGTLKELLVPGTLIANNAKNSNFLTGLKNLTLGHPQSGGHNKTQTRKRKSIKLKDSLKKVNGRNRSFKRKNSQTKILYGGGPILAARRRFNYYFRSVKYVKGPNDPDNMTYFLGDPSGDTVKFNVSVVNNNKIIAIPTLASAPSDLENESYLKVYYSIDTNNTGRIKTNLVGDTNIFKNVISDLAPDGFFASTNIPSTAQLVNHITTISNAIYAKITAENMKRIRPTNDVFKCNEILGFNADFIPDLANGTYKKYPYQETPSLLFPYQVEHVSSWNPTTNIDLCNYATVEKYKSNAPKLLKKLYSIGVNNMCRPAEVASVLLPQNPGVDDHIRKKEMIFSTGVNGTVNRLKYIDLGIVVDDAKNKYLKPEENSEQYTNTARFNINKNDKTDLFSCTITTDPASNDDNFKKNFEVYSAAVDNGLIFINFFLKMFKTQIELSMVEFLNFNRKLYSALYDNDAVSVHNRTVVITSGSTVADSNPIYNYIKQKLDAQNMYSTKWGEYADPIMKFHNHIIRDWTDGNFKKANAPSIDGRAMTAIKGLLSIPQFNDNNYSGLINNNKPDKLQQLAKEILAEESPDIPLGYAYYHHILHTMIVQRLKQKEIMDYLDPTTNTGKTNLQNLGFKLS
jgi:hypothetical protein